MHAYFEVSVDDVFGVEVADCGNDFCSVKARSVLGKQLHAGEMVEELAPVHVLHHETQTVVRLEGILQLLQTTTQMFETTSKHCCTGSPRVPQGDTR